MQDFQHTSDSKAAVIGRAFGVHHNLQVISKISILLSKLLYTTNIQDSG